MHTDGLLHAILDAGEIGVALLSHDGTVVLWNHWLAEASGVESDLAQGKTLVELFPDLAGTRISHAVAEALQHGMSALLSSSLHKRLLPLCKRGRDGNREPMKQIAVIKPLEVGDAKYCLLQVTDTTAAVAREQVLRQQARTMQALAENYRLSELHMRAIVDNTGDAIVTFDAEGVIGTYNAAAERIFGYEPAEIVGKDIGVLIPLLGASTRHTTAQAAEGFMGARREIGGVRRDGTRFPLELSVSEMELGGQRLFIGIAHDITDRKKADEELRNQKEWLATLINAMPDIICFKDGEGRWLVANEFYLNLFELSGIEYQGKTAAELAQLSWRYGEDLVASLETDRQAWREGRSVAFETSLSGADGLPKVFDVIKLPLFNVDGSRKGLVMVGRDITDRKQAAARIQHLAHHDSLTDLPNRVLFQERLRQSLAHAKRAGHLLALMFLDLDRFKEVNDTLGHHMGDLLLKAVAKRLQRCVRETDTVARLGGDEFAILLTNLSSVDGASTVAESIIRAVADPFGLDGNEVITSTSIGITVFPNDAMDAEPLLKYADLALYRSKAEGRNNYHFYIAQMDAEVQARKAIERDLRHALGTDQLTMFFQPLIDVETGHISGSEALIRWFHPKRGFVSPAEFIPIVERTDLIYPLGRWILQHACTQAGAWQRQGIAAARVAVNLSAAQFKHQDLVAIVKDVLEQSGLDASLLQLEITESIAMHNVEATIETLNQLRALGVTISIDDFGTGYSSLNYLKKFPVDKLKIDRSFVTDIGLHPDNAAIVKTIINLGHGIGCKVNVEGIETTEQMDFLRDNGVDEAQGFLFSKPLPAMEFEKLVTSVPWWLEQA
jgi:diguanylate cyclase (GGDEF)-like protein/PAS domain S-box-containing protein